MFLFVSFVLFSVCSLVDDDSVWFFPSFVLLSSSFLLLILSGSVHLFSLAGEFICASGAPLLTRVVSTLRVTMIDSIDVCLMFLVLGLRLLLASIVVHPCSSVCLWYVCLPCYCL
jgi:hypothetical protein